MSSPEQSVLRARSTFGHWRRPASAGLGNLGIGGTAVLFVGLIVAVLMAWWRAR